MRNTKHAHPGSTLRSALPGIAAALLLAVSAQAKIDLVTLPQRDQTQLTIYKSEDLTLVRETRELTFKKGSNQIQFSWANTLIDPTSLQMRFVTPTPDFQVLDASYPASTSNTIIWNIESAREGKAAVEITYFASGLTWRADYTAIANDDETRLRLEPDFTITNTSGEDFENATTRLVVGEINLVDAISRLASLGIIGADKEEGTRRQMAKTLMQQERRRDEAVFDRLAGSAAPASAASEAVLNRAKDIIKAAVSEYYLYSIEGTEDLKTGWGKQLPNPRVQEIPIKVSYEFEPMKYGDSVVKFYKFKNDKEHKLGDVPLPEGQYYIYSGDGRKGIRYQATFAHKYIPVGEDIELNCGSDGRLLLDQRQMALTRTNFDFDNDGNVRGFDTIEEREIELRNSNGYAVPVKIRLPFGTGDWEVKDSNTTFRKVDRSTGEWQVDVPALDKLVIKYTQVTRTGSRDRTSSGYTAQAGEPAPDTTMQSQ